MEIKFSKSIKNNSSAVMVALSDKLKLTPNVNKLDKALGGMISSMMSVETFKGRKEDHVQSLAVAKDKSTTILSLIGAGKAKELSGLSAIKLGGKIYAMLKSLKVKEASLVLDEAIPNMAEVAANIAYGVLLRSYKFEKYKTKDHKDKKEKINFSKLEIVIDEDVDAKKIFAKLEAIAKGVYFARDLVTEPPNVLYPETFAAEVLKLEELGVKVEILGEKEMHKLGMGSLLGVGQGSKRESKLAIMQYNGAPKAKNKQPLAFIGKGVTFDTGGISLKPAGGMEDMKYDMAGAAAVSGLMKALAERKAKVNVVGIIGLVENMPGSNAQRPSDVVTSMSGQTIEVLNTDAEGRLVLADALWYCQFRFKPQFMINLATLTGAIVVTFGSIYGGLFSNDDKLSDKILKASNQSGENLWRLPLNDIYDKQINSDIADMQNITHEKGGGSITAAQFLKRFVNDVPWAHLDIAGMAWTKKDLEHTPKGATGFGVRLLNQLIEDHFEEK
jgi:leucyl aminopeptidase